MFLQRFLIHVIQMDVLIPFGCFVKQAVDASSAVDERLDFPAAFQFFERDPEAFRVVFVGQHDGESAGIPVKLPVVPVIIRLMILVQHLLYGFLPAVVPHAGPDVLRPEPLDKIVAQLLHRFFEFFGIVPILLEEVAQSVRPAVSADIEAVIRRRVGIVVFGGIAFDQPKQGVCRRVALPRLLRPRGVPSGIRKEIVIRPVLNRFRQTERVIELVFLRHRRIDFCVRKDRGPENRQHDRSLSR